MFFPNNSRLWDRVKCMTINMFFVNFLLLLEVRTVQFGITFGKHAEIYLKDRKYQMSSNFFETPTQQHIRRLLLVKKVLEIPTIKNRNTNYSCVLHSKSVHLTGRN